MDQSEIKQLLKASGKDFFVKYYLDMRSDTDAKALKQLLLSSEDYTKQSINTRVSKSRKVISSGYGLQALFNIVNSDRVAKLTKKQAKELINQLLPTSGNHDELIEALISLKPTEKKRVIDLVEASGIDISDWSNFKGGKEKAATNPRYCYEWSFIDEIQETVVLNLWYSDMEIIDGGIGQSINMRAVADKELVNPLQKKRALRMDGIISEAHTENYQIRIVVCDGKKRNLDEMKSSKAQNRLLDPIEWYISSYENGICTLKRGKGTLIRFIDQIDVFGKNEKKARISEVFYRCPKIRRSVLNRAKGHCEYCGEKGFLTVGGIYLETHHITPLSDNGDDSIENVIALCPNHHKEAHFAIDSPITREKLYAIVAIKLKSR